MTKFPPKPLSSGSIFAVITMFFVVAGCTSIPTALNPIAVPLQYKTMANAGEFPNMPQCAAISGIQANDVRTTSTIGKRYVETNPSVTAPVSASSDVKGWIRSGAEASVQRVGIKQKATGPVLRLNVRQIVTSENVARRSGYEARIVITAELVRKGGGTCWQDRI